MKPIITLAVAILSTVAAGQANASEFYSLLDVRFQNGVKRTFIGGPFAGKDNCEKLNRNIWDSMQPVCSSCTLETKFCAPFDSLNQPFRAIMNGEPSPLVYVIATKKNRIVFTGATRQTVVNECEEVARSFRANGYADSRCVK